MIQSGKKYLILNTRGSLIFKIIAFYMFTGAQEYTLVLSGVF